MEYVQVKTIVTQEMTGPDSTEMFHLRKQPMLLEIIMYTIEALIIINDIRLCSYVLETSRITNQDQVWN